MSAKILVLDVERCPMWTKRMPVWDMKGLLNRRLGPDDIEEWGRVICLAYQWLGERKVHFIAEWQEGGRKAFLEKSRDIYSEAHMVVGHNSIGFDTKHLQGEWELEGLGPAAPFDQFDTLIEARKHFNYEANHLDTLTRRFGLPHKTDKYRIQMAMDAIGGDVRAQRKIERYNIGDVRATTQLYLRLRPWGRVNLGVFVDDDRPLCPACGKATLQRRGYTHTRISTFQRFQCQAPGCGKWARGKKSVRIVEARPA